VIQYHADGSGRWAIRNRVTGYYVGGTDDMIQCYEKQAGPSEWWFIHLAIHPQVCRCYLVRYAVVTLSQIHVITTNPPDTKSKSNPNLNLNLNLNPNPNRHPNPNPNPNPTTKQYAVMSIQLNIVTCPLYLEKLIRDNVVAPSVPTFRCHCHTAPRNQLCKLCVLSLKILTHSRWRSATRYLLSCHPV